MKANQRGRSAKTAIFCLLALVTAFVAPAHGEVWDDTFLFDSGFENPLVRVGFNPQPDPPMGMVLMGEPTNPGISVMADPGSPFQLLFALGQEGESYFVGEIPEPDMDGNTMFQIFQPGAIPIVAFEVAFNFQTSSGGIVTPGSWVSFNPQPEPPALMPAGTVAFGFDFEFTSLSEATMYFSITDVQAGQELSFTHIPAVIPEPATMTLLGLGLAGFAVRSRKRVS